MDIKFQKILNEVNPEIFESSSVDLIEDGIIDSLVLMQIVSTLESNYAINFDPDDLVPENFASVQAIWDLLQKYHTIK